MRKRPTYGDIYDISAGDVAMVMQSNCWPTPELRSALGFRLRAMINGGRALIENLLDVDRDAVAGLADDLVGAIGGSSNDMADSMCLGAFTGTYKANPAVAIRAAAVGSGRTPSGLLSKDVAFYQIAFVLFTVVMRLHVAAHWLRSEGKHPIISDMVAMSFAQSVSMIEECLWAAEEKTPALDDVRKRYVEVLKQWRPFRDDAAHLAERYLRDSLGSAHDCESDADGSRIVVMYDPEYDALRTGDERGSLLEACDASAAILHDLEARAKEEVFILIPFTTSLNRRARVVFWSSFNAVVRCGFAERPRQLIWCLIFNR